MGLFLCRTCNEQLTLDPPHACNPEDVRKYVREMEDRAREAENKLDQIRNAVLMTLQSLPSLDGDRVAVETEWLRRLWKAAEYEKEQSADCFLARWLALHRLLTESFDLFRSSRGETLLEKLKAVKAQCDHAKKVLGYEKSKLDLEPEDLV